LPSLINFLRVDLPFTLVKTTMLFDEATLPIGVSKTAFFKAVFQLSDFETRGSTIYYSGSSGEGTNRCFLHRDEWRCFVSRSSGEFEDIIKANIRRVTKDYNVPDATKVDRIRSKLTAFLKRELAQENEVDSCCYAGITDDSG
jgi:hypothetical protein